MWADTHPRESIGQEGSQGLVTDGPVQAVRLLLAAPANCCLPASRCFYSPCSGPWGLPQPESFPSTTVAGQVNKGVPQGETCWSALPPDPRETPGVPEGSHTATASRNCTPRGRLCHIQDISVLGNTITTNTEARFQSLHADKGGTENTKVALGLPSWPWASHCRWLRLLCISGDSKGWKMLDKATLLLFMHLVACSISSPLYPALR